MDMDFLEELEEAGVTMSFFQKSSEVIQFLEYLFKARPGLLNQTAHNIFRIVVYLQGNSSRDCGSLVNRLKNIGCKAPILVFTQCKMFSRDCARLSEKYANILFVRDPLVLRQFCKMGMSIKQLQEKGSLLHFPAA